MESIQEESSSALIDCIRRTRGLLLRFSAAFVAFLLFLVVVIWISSVSRPVDDDKRPSSQEYDLSQVIYPAPNGTYETVDFRSINNSLQWMRILLQQDRTAKMCMPPLKLPNPPFPDITVIMRMQLCNEVHPYKLCLLGCFANNIDYVRHLLVKLELQFHFTKLDATIRNISMHGMMKLYYCPGRPENVVKLLLPEWQQFSPEVPPRIQIRIWPQSNQAAWTFSEGGLEPLFPHVVSGRYDPVDWNRLSNVWFNHSHI